MAEVPETDNTEAQTGKKKRSRFRVVLTHVFRSAVWPPWLVRYLLFVFFAVSRIPLPAAVFLWLVGNVAIHIFSLRRSLSLIDRYCLIESAPRCATPAAVCFVGFGLFNLLIDVALISNSGRRPGPLILLALILNTGIVWYQSGSTKKFFYAMAGQAVPGRKWFSVHVMTAVGDAIIMIGLILLVIAVINGGG